MGFVHWQVLNTWSVLLKCPLLPTCASPAPPWITLCFWHGDIHIVGEKNCGLHFDILYRTFTKFVPTEYLLMNWLEECKFLIHSLKTWGIVIFFRSDTCSYRWEALDLCLPASSPPVTSGTLLCGECKGHKWWWEAAGSAIRPLVGLGRPEGTIPAPLLGSSGTVARFLSTLKE